MTQTIIDEADFTRTERREAAFDVATNLALPLIAVLGAAVAVVSQAGAVTGAEFFSALSVAGVIAQIASVIAGLFAAAHASSRIAGVFAVALTALVNPVSVALMAVGL